MHDTYPTEAEHTATKFCWLINLNEGEIFTESIPAAMAKLLLTQMVTRDLFAVTNLLVKIQL